MVKDYTTTLTTKEQLNDVVWRFVFTLQEGEKLEFIPGQYMLLKIDTSYRQYSISSPTFQQDSFELIVEMIPGGLASVYLYNLKIGQNAYFKGPAGVFILKDSEKHKIFLATGTGIAPIKSMVYSALENQIETERIRNTEFYLFFGLKSDEEQYLYKDFSQLGQKHSNFHFYMCLSRQGNLNGLDPRYFRLGRVNMHVNSTLIPGFVKENVNNYEYYICGSRHIVDSLKEFVIGLGVGSESIFFERFTL